MAYELEQSKKKVQMTKDADACFRWQYFKKTFLAVIDLGQGLFSFNVVSQLTTEHTHRYGSALQN